MPATERLYVQIDLCGRQPPRTGEADVLGLTDDDLDHIHDMIAAGREANIGEMRYRLARDDERVEWARQSWGGPAA